MITPAIWKAPFQVNVTTLGNQYGARVVTAADGSFYTVWVDDSGIYSAGTALVGRHFDAAGNPLNYDSHGNARNEFILAGNESSPAIATLANHQIGIAFSDYTNGDTYIVYYNSTLEYEFFVPVETTPSISVNPAVTGFGDSGIFVTYTSQITTQNWTIVGRQISSTGVAGPAISLFDDGAMSDHSQLATLNNGNFVVAFKSGAVNSGGFDDTGDIDFQIRAEDGSVVRNATLAYGGTGVIGVNADPSVAALQSGGFVLAWSKTLTHDRFYSYTDIMAVVYDRDGNHVRQVWLDAAAGTGYDTLSNAHVSATNDGGFLVTWTDITLNGNFVQRFDAFGNELGAPVLVHSGASSSSIAGLPDGRTVFSFDDTNSGDTNVVDAIYDTRSNVTSHVTGHDLFGDGGTDQLLLSAAPANNLAGGLVTMMAISGGAITQIGAVGSDWSVAASGDFNGDGRQDILMQHDLLSNYSPGQRELYIFSMGSSAVTGATALGQVGVDWQVDGTGDFDGSGNHGVLLQRLHNGAQELTILGVNNNVVTSVTSAGLLGSTYQVDGIGDLNKDGKDDILVHYDDANGRHFVELDQAHNITQTIKAVANIGAEWNAAGMGDFNGDGYADILIHTDTASGRDIGILINQGGNGWVFKDLGPIVGKNVQIDGIGDFNADGTADISAHYDTSGTSRTDVYLEVHNAAITAIHTTGTVGHEWIVS